MELRPAKQGRNPIDFLPEEVWIKIFETGVSQENKFTIKDISSLLVTCKLFYKLWSEDALWSLLVTLDFPQFANDGGSKPYSSSSQKLLYKYGLARHCKHKFVYFDHQFKRLETDIRVLSERIQRQDDRLKRATDELEVLMEGVQESVAKGIPVGMAAAATAMIASLRGDLAKYRKREDLMQFFVLLQEACEKHIRCLKTCLVELCTGCNPIQIVDLWVEGDKIEDDSSATVKEDVDDYVDVDTDDEGGDDYFSSDDSEDEEGVNVTDDEDGFDYSIFFNNDAEEEEDDDDDEEEEDDDEEEEDK